MKNTEYGNIKVPMGLLIEIDKIVKQEKNGYRSRNEFCVDGLRQFLKRFNNNYQGEKEGKRVGGEEKL